MPADLSRGELRHRIRTACGWIGDRTDEYRYADLTGWWRSPDLLATLGPALAGLFAADRPTIVLGIESRGCLLGPLVAVALGVGFVEIRKGLGPSSDSDAWVHRTTPPDYRDRHLSLGLPTRLLGSGDRAVLVDDWIETGGQAIAAQLLAFDREATWLGVATVVDGLSVHQVRRRLNVRSLVHQRDL